MLKKREKYIPLNPMFDGRALKKLIIPLVIEQFLAIMVGMFDTIMVSSAGEAAVSGVSLVDSINILLINIFAAFATGGAVVVSQHIGARRYDKANESAEQLLFTVLSCAVLIMTFILVFRQPVIDIVFGKIEKDVMDNAMVYIIYSAISYPFLALYNACAALYRSQGNSKVSMYTSLLMNVVNITGNAILIYGFGMGVAGAAIATLVSRILGAVIMLFLTSNGKNGIHVNFCKRFVPDFGIIKSIMKIGIPNGLENSFFQLGKIIILSLVTMFGTAQIAANAVANSISAMVVIPGNAIGLAMITVVGQCVGAKDDKQALYYVKKLMGYVYIILTAMSVTIMLVLPFLLQLYSLSEEATHYAYTITYMYCITTIIFWPPSFTLPNALRAANDVKYTMWVAISSMVVFRVAFSYVLGLWLNMGVVGVWIAMFIDWICRDVFFISRIAGGGWKKRMGLSENKQ